MSTGCFVCLKYDKRLEKEQWLQFKILRKLLYNLLFRIEGRNEPAFGFMVTRNEQVSEFPLSPYIEAS